MAVNNFIPVIWTATALRHLEKALVYGQPGVVNRDYEGEVADAGDSVKINSIGPVTVASYVKNSNMTDPQELQDAQSVMPIDQAESFNFQLDDVDKVQMNVDLMNSAMQESAYGLRDAADRFLAAKMKDNVPVANTVGTEAAPKTDLGTEEKAYNYLIDLGTLLSESNTPPEGRWVIVPPWFHGLLQKDARFTHATDMGDDIIVNGKIKKAAGFNILESNNVPYATTTTKFKIIAGHSWATTYAEQIVKVEAYRMEKRFADGVKGLHVYGAHVVRPNQLAMLIANRA